MLISPTIQARFLQTQAWFRALPVADQARLEANVRLVRGRKGEVVLRAGDVVEGWYGVVSGLVKLQSHSPEGRTSVFVGLPAGQWFGEGSALKKEARRYDVVALRESTLLCLPCAEFDHLFNTSIGFTQAVVWQMNMRLGQAMAAIEASRVRTPEQRVALYLSRVFWHGIQKLDLSQEELSNIVGLSRQTVNRALQVLEQQGLLSLQLGRIGVRNDDALTAFVFGDAAEADSEVASR